MTGDGLGNLWATDVGGGAIRARWKNVTSGAWVWQSTFVTWPFTAPSFAASILYHNSTASLYFSDTTAIVRAAVNVSAYGGTGGLGVNTTVVNQSFSSVSNLTWSADQRSIYLLDGGAVKQMSVFSYTVTVLAPSSSFTQPTALSLLPDGASLLIADLQSGGYSVLKRLSLSNLSLSLFASNTANSSCSGTNATYQSGALSTSCWGLIHAMTLGSGAASGKVFVLEVNTGRMKVIDYWAGMVSVLLGGGKANSFLSNATNPPSGWASGVGVQSSFERTTGPIIFDSTGLTGYIAEPVNLRHL